ncbi:hypothetical protein NSERUTF1_0033 [Nocardia seriolae]|nr:hypothetical protein NSERUTF1_0033 [Nocardia seriolae]
MISTGRSESGSAAASVADDSTQSLWLRNLRLARRAYNSTRRNDPSP